MKVDKLMSRDVKTCSPNHSLAHAAALMWENDCGCIPIVEGGRVVGMITDRDICMAACFQGRPIQEIPVGACMSRQLVSCRPDDSIDTAETAMRRAQVRRLPVTDPSGRLLGILSLNDIARAATRDQATRSPEVGLNDVALTLGAVCERRSSSSAAASYRS